MLLTLMLLFVLVPLAELSLLVYIGTVIGILYTVLIVVATGLVGAVLARYQGLAALSRVRASLEQGILPANELFEGMLILIGGLLLLTPGVITDAVGFALLVPYTRRVVAAWLRRWMGRRISKRETGYWELR